MALSNPCELEEKQFAKEDSLFAVIPVEQGSDEIRSNQLRISADLDARAWLFPEDRALELKDDSRRIQPQMFSLNNPWLPVNAIKLLNKLKAGPLRERELVTLMELVGERATTHFQLPEGKFVAMTFNGRVVEASDTRVDLLKRIQSQKYQEGIFVWRIGSKAFSGRT